MKSARQARALWRISHIAKSSTRLVSQGQSVSSLAISVSPDAPTTRPLDNVLIRSRQFSSRSTTALAVPLAPSPSNATSRPETLILDSSKRMVSSGNGAFQYTIGDIMDSVIKVFATSSTSHYLVPWQNRPLREGMGSGFIIDRKRIITNAHVVSDAVQVRFLSISTKSFTFSVLPSLSRGILCLFIIITSHSFVTPVIIGFWWLVRSWCMDVLTMYIIMNLDHFFVCSPL